MIKCSDFTFTCSCPVFSAPLIEGTVFLYCIFLPSNNIYIFKLLSRTILQFTLQWQGMKTSVTLKPDQHDFLVEIILEDMMLQISPGHDICHHPRRVSLTFILVL